MDHVAEYLSLISDVAKIERRDCTNPIEHLQPNPSGSSSGREKCKTRVLQVQPVSLLVLMTR